MPNREDDVIKALRRITRAIDLHSRELLQAYGLTSPQLAALRELGRREAVSMSELARAMHLSQATLTGVLDRLEKRGLARRARSGTDRRSVVVQLTDEGRVLLESAPPLLQEQFRRRYDQLADWEQSQMLSMLQRVAALMDTEEGAESNMVQKTTSPADDRPRKDMTAIRQPVPRAAKQAATKETITQETDEAGERLIEAK